MRLLGNVSRCSRRIATLLKLPFYGFEAARTPRIPGHDGRRDLMRTIVGRQLYMRMTADMFKCNSLHLMSIWPTLLAKRLCDPYIWDAMAFSQMKRNC